MMEKYLTANFDEAAAMEKYAIDEVQKAIKVATSKKTGAQHTPKQERRDTYLICQRRAKDARARKLKNAPEEGREGKLRSQQLPRKKTPDNFHNKRAEKVAKDELANFVDIEMEVFEPITA